MAPAASSGDRAVHECGHEYTNPPSFRACVNRGRGTKSGKKVSVENASFVYSCRIRGRPGFRATMWELVSDNLCLHPAIPVGAAVAVRLSCLGVPRNAVGRSTVQIRACHRSVNPALKTEQILRLRPQDDKTRQIGASLRWLTTHACTNVKADGAKADLPPAHVYRTAYPRTSSVRQVQSP